MEQFIVTVSNDSDAEALFDCMKESLLRSIAVEIDLTDRKLIELRFPEMSWTKDIAEAIALFIVNHMEAVMIRRILLQRSASYEPHEIKEIIQYCEQLLHDDEVTLDSSKHDRRRWIQDQLHLFFQSHDHLNIEGFMNFRLKKYMGDLQDTVDEACDEFLLNEQYQEFIALLKYFVYFQDTKIPEVHLIHRGNNKFELLDGNLQQLDLSDAKDVIFETVDRELNYEDMVVSALISASPKKIHIHTREPESQSIKTIQQIFEGRTSICTCCQLCKNSLGEWKAERLT